MAGNRVVAAIGPSYTLNDRKAACQRAVNMRLQLVEGVGEDKQMILASVEGWDEFADLTDPIRGQYSAGDRYFVVRGDDLLEVSASGTTTTRGTLTSSAGFVSMRHNADQLAIVDGGTLYIFNLTTNVFSVVSSPGWIGSNFVDYLDGYFVFVRPDSEQFYISAIDDGTSIDGLDFSSADRQPDKIVTHRVFKGELYLFGEQSTEPWVNSGGTDFPFIRYNATPIEIGIVGERAVATTLDTLVWVGRTKNGQGIVYSMQGYQPTRISTQAIEERLADADLSTCVCWTYYAPGCEFVGIEADGMDTTLVYDFVTQQWHERATGSSAAWSPLGVHSVVFHQGMHLAAVGSDLLERNPDSYSFGGAQIVRDRVWPHLVSPSFEPVSYRSLELGCTTGYGGNCFLQISNDGGFTWGPMLVRSLGAIGRWMERVRWHWLGSARDRVFRIGCSDAVPFSLYAANVDAT